ncbi:MAG: hypothetical protein IJ218_05320 [Alphaproteobacteria bacterium]|nr:hypothetical protein [Alphaproteobacteria bacterium]
MNLSKSELAEIVATRTCHDLIGNIGTLKNVLDFVETDVHIDAETKNLLNDVSRVLNARQKFFRVAFGLETHAADNAELLSLCQNYVATIGTRGHNISLDLHGASNQLSKMVCLCVMIAADVFIRGGNIELNINKENIMVHAETEFKFNETELAGYQMILQHQKPKDNLSQYAQLLYLQNIIGSDVPMKLVTSANEITFIIG